MFVLLLIHLLVVISGTFAVDTFTIAGLFHDDNYQAEMSFKYAIKKYNMFNPDIKFKPKILHVTKTDSFAISKQVCNLISAEDGVVAIFGPESPAVSPMVQSICINFEIPHIQTNYQHKTNYASTTVLNFYPDYQLLAYCQATVLRELEWDTIAVLYETTIGLIRVQEILKITSKESPPATVRQLPDGGDYRPLLKQIKHSQEYNIIIDCRIDRVLEILKQAQEMGLMEFYYNYLLTMPDAHTLNFQILQTYANITAIRFADPYNPVLHNVLRDWETGEMLHNRRIRLTTTDMLAESILTHDAVNFFMHSFRELHLIEPIASRSLSCDVKEKWEAGFRLTTYMKVRPMKNALSGNIRFNEWGKRVDFTVQLLEIVENVHDKTAIWTPDNPDRVNFTFASEYYFEDIAKTVQNLQKTTVIVSSRLTKPYLMLREASFPGEILKGNSRYHGYAMDLIDAIAKDLNFTYRLELVADGTYGHYDPKMETWTGLIGDVVERKAHLAICDLTITHERRTAVDFSLPFMYFGVSILHHQPVPTKQNLFAFLEPLHPTVWIYLVSGNITLCCVMYYVLRMAPGDWENRQPNNRHPKELKNVWTFKNCIWLVIGSTLGKGCSVLPKGISSRMAIAMWWYLALILRTSHTANLATFLTLSEKTGPIIETAKALAEQTRIKYGTVETGATRSFFMESNYSTYARMWSQMSNNPSVFEHSTSNGVKRVLTTKNQLYAFIMDSSTLEYEIARNCELRQIGGKLDSKGYGIAMPVNSGYRTAIDRMIIKYHGDGTLKRLKQKWWHDIHGKVTCKRFVNKRGLKSLTLANVGGVFIVTGVGLIFAFIITLGEFLWNVHTVAVRQRITHCGALKLELKFAVTVWITEKKTNAAKRKKSPDKENKTVALYNPLNGGKRLKKIQ